MRHGIHLKSSPQFLNIAGGSLSELDTQIEIADIIFHLITIEQKQELDNKMESISGKLAGLIKHVKKKVR